MSMDFSRKLPIPKEIKEQFPLPWIVKPCNAGSSYGVSKVNNKEEFDKLIEQLGK